MAKAKAKVNKKEIKKYRNILLELKERTLKELNTLENDTLGKSQKDFSGDLSGYSLHMADVGTDTFDREFALGLASNQQQLLYDIDEALKRIEEDAYGICEMCEKPLTLKRLKALPFAKLCVKCQEDIEKKK